MDGDLDLSDEEEEDWQDQRWAQPITTAVSTTHNMPCKPSTSFFNQKSGEHQSFPETRNKKVAITQHPSIPSKQVTHQQDASTGEIIKVTSLLLNDNKAGMEGLDREKINKIIHEASKGSRFYQKELQKEEQLAKRIEEQRQRILCLSPDQLHQAQIQADNMLAELESTRDLSHTIVHVDMDAFYAAVEMRDNPDLKDVPMAVGGISMLSTSNYLARRFGVRAAMPGFIGKKLCPNLVIVPANFEKYQEVSQQIRDIMVQYDTNFCPMSLDEAFLDFTNHLTWRNNSDVLERKFYSQLDAELVCKCQAQDTRIEEEISDKEQNHLVGEHKETDSRNKGSSKAFEKSQKHDLHSKADKKVCSTCRLQLDQRGEATVFGTSIEEAVREMRFRIQQTTRLTASAGIAPNTLLAKICSDKNKPNGQYLIPPKKDEILTFVNDLPIRKVWGIGKVSEKLLGSLGIETCADLYTHRAKLLLLYSPISFNHFMRVSIGIGSTKVERDGERKSMSVERTFDEINRPAELFKKCLEMSESLAEDLKAEAILGKTVTLKLKTVTFEIRTRAHSLAFPTREVDSIYSAARELLRTEIQSALPQPLKLRLMGVRMSNLLHEDETVHTKHPSIADMFKKMTAKGSPTKADSTPSAAPERNEQQQGDDQKQFDTQYEAGIQKSKDFPEGSRHHKPGCDMEETVSSHHSEDTVLQGGSVGRGERICPVCGKQVKSKSMKVFNIHLDWCLQRQTGGTSGDPLSDNEPPDGKRNNEQTVKTLFSEKVQCGLEDTQKTVLNDSVQTQEISSENEFLDIGQNFTNLVRDDSSKIVHIAEEEGFSENLCDPVNIIQDTCKEQYNCEETKTDVPWYSEQTTHKSHNSSVNKTTHSDNEMKDESECLNANNGDIKPACNSYQNSVAENVCAVHAEGTEHHTVTQVPLKDQPVLTGMFRSPGRNDNPCKAGSSEHHQPDLSNARETMHPPASRDHEVIVPSAVKDEMYSCPVCGQDVTVPDLSHFNSHVDACLNRQAIREIIKQQNNMPLKRPGDGQSLITQPATKRKKTTNARTIESFFKK